MGDQTVFISGPASPHAPTRGNTELNRIGNYNYAEERLKKLNHDALYLEEQEKQRVMELCLSFIAQGKTVSAVVKELRAQFHWFSPGYLYKWRTEDADFCQAWDEAYAAGTDMLEDKAIDLALEGNASLLQFLLKSRNIERYGTTRVENTGKDGRDLIPSSIQVRVLPRGQSIADVKEPTNDTES